MSDSPTPRWTWGPVDEYSSQRDTPEYKEASGLTDHYSGNVVLCASGCENAGISVRHDAARLIAAAPELLAMLRRLAHAANTRALVADLPELTEAYALLKRIEGDGE